MLVIMLVLVIVPSESISSPKGRTHRGTRKNMTVWTRGLRRAVLGPPILVISTLRPPSNQDAPAPPPGSSESNTGGGNRLHSTRWDSNWDFREHQSAARRRSGGDEEGGDKVVTRHLYLIRHGQYVMAKKDEDRVLTILGREQAQLMGKRLLETGIKFNKITFSTMTRATETGKLIAEFLPDVPTEACHLCREGAPIQPEPPHKTWNPAPHLFFTEGARIEAAFRHYFYRPGPEQKEDSHEVIVCHGNVIRYWVCRALQLPPEAWLRIAVANASLTRIDIRSNGHVSLMGLGEVGFMPHNLKTFT